MAYVVLTYREEWTGVTMEGGRVQTKEEYEKWRKEVEKKYDEAGGHLQCKPSQRLLDLSSIYKYGEYDGEHTKDGYFHYLEVREVFDDEAEAILEHVGKEWGLFIDPLRDSFKEEEE